MNRKTAKLAGLFFLLTVIAGLFAEIFFRQKIFTDANPAVIAENIVDNEFLFRAGIASDLLMALCYLLTALTLYKLLSSVNKYVAILMVVFATAGSVLLMGNVLNEYAPLVLLTGAGSFADIGADQLNALASLFYQLYLHGYMIGQIFFALWVLPLGVLIYQSKFIPKVFGILFIIETVFGLVSVAIHFLMPNGTLESIAMVPMMVAEFSFLAYLWFAGLLKRHQTD